jgi:hypothetical protein
MADIGAELAGFGQTDQRVEVRSVDIDLPARLVHQAADLGDPLFVHPVRRRVGDHDRRQPVAVVGQLGAQVVDVDGAVRGRAHHDDPHARHHRGRRVRPVRTGRDEADVTPVVAAPAMEGTDGKQTGELTLRPGVRLQ